MKKFVLRMFSLLALPFIASCGSFEQARLDAEVDRLCAIDGGVKVYETVTLPPDKFNKWGQINFYRPTQGENALGPAYIFKWDTHAYKEGAPAINGPQETSMKRYHFKITRKEDMKLLGEFIRYNRAGGDLPGPWMPTSYHCPDRLEANDIVLIHKIFIKSSEGKNQ